jgi:hypothetical protein
MARPLYEWSPRTRAAMVIGTATGLSARTYIPWRCSLALGVQHRLSPTREDRCRRRTYDEIISCRMPVRTGCISGRFGRLLMAGTGTLVARCVVAMQERVDVRSR